MKQEKTKRNKAVKKLFEDGIMTEVEIARLLRLSRQRIHQIVRGYSSYKPKSRSVDNSALDEQAYKNIINIIKQKSKLIN